MKMSNIQEGSVWRYQAFLVTSPTMLWKKLFWTYFQNVLPLSTLHDYHRLKSANNVPQKVIIKLSKRKDVYRVLKAIPSLKNVTLMELEYLLAPLNL